MTKTKTYLAIVILIILILSGTNSCKKKLNEVDKNLLYVNAFDTVAQISFPNYLSLDTCYTWDDESDCACCGKLKTRYQNKKDQSHKESGFLDLRLLPKNRTYLTYIFPEHLKCFNRNVIKENELFKFEEAKSENLLENDLYNGRAKNLISLSYTNNKFQRVSISGATFYSEKQKELYVVIYVSTFNKRNYFPVDIKFEKLSKTSIREFVKNSLKTIHLLEIK